MKLFSLLKRLFLNQATNQEKGIVASVASGFIMITTLFGSLFKVHFLVEIGVSTMLLTTILLLSKFMYDAFQE